MANHRELGSTERRILTDSTQIRSKRLAKYSDYLISKKFGDFILTLQYKYPPRETVECFSVLGIPKIRSKTELNAKFSTRSVSLITKWVTMITG